MQKASQELGLAHQALVRDNENAGVRLEVDTLAATNRLQTLDSDVFLVAETKTNDVQHIFF